MSDFKEDIKHTEVNDIVIQKTFNEQDAEVAEALRNYVPNTEAEKKLVRKIDIRLMPILFIMYIMNYIDRTNIVSIPKQDC